MVVWFFDVIGQIGAFYCINIAGALFLEESLMLPLVILFMSVRILKLIDFSSCTGV